MERNRPMSTAERLLSNTIASAPGDCVASAGGGAVRMRRKRSLRSKAGAIFAAIAPHAKAQRQWYVRGAIFAVILVEIRVMMPWPLQLLIKPWLEGGSPGWTGIPGVHPAVVVGLIYAVLVSVLGYADYRLRLNFARFAIGVVRDIRATVLGKIGQIRRIDPDRTTGDLVTRLVGDGARLKAGLKGFLVHVATNGLLFLGISAVLLWMDWVIGLIFLSASLLAMMVTAVGASRIFRLAIKYRRRETKIADTIASRVALEDEDEDGVEDESLNANRSSGRHEARITRLQGLTTWSAHFILAIAVPAALWRGFYAVENGVISPGDLFVVMLYALMILGPMVRLTRQGARCGKIMANANRLRVLLQRAESNTVKEREKLPPLYEGVVLNQMKVRARGGEGNRRKFGPIDLEVEVGQKVAVIGTPGVGKTTLLSVLAGRERYKGSVTWDGVELRDASYDSLQERICYVVQSRGWTSVDVSQIIGSDDGVVEDGATRKILKHGGFKRLRGRLGSEDLAKVGPEEVSHSERKMIGLLRSLKSNHPLMLIDDPVGGIAPKRAARKIVAALLAERSVTQTVVVALDRPVGLRHFDRVIVLGKKGRLVFDGSPEEWKEQGGPFEQVSKIEESTLEEVDR